MNSRFFEKMISGNKQDTRRHLTLTIFRKGPRGACQILLSGFFPLRAVSLGDAANFLISTFGNLFSP